MKPVLIINGMKPNIGVRYIHKIRHRALQTENIVEALKVTKYVAPGMVISYELINSNDLKLIANQIFNNPLTPCIPSIYYNASLNVKEIASFFNKIIPKDSKHIYIDKALSSKELGYSIFLENIGTFN